MLNSESSSSVAASLSGTRTILEDSVYARQLFFFFFPCHPPMIEWLLRSKRSPNSNFCYHQFRSTQFGGWPLLLESVFQFKDTFRNRYLGLYSLIVSRAKKKKLKNPDCFVLYALPILKRERSTRRGLNLCASSCRCMDDTFSGVTVMV